MKKILSFALYENQIANNLGVLIDAMIKNPYGKMLIDQAVVEVVKSTQGGAPGGQRIPEELVKSSGYEKTKALKVRLDRSILYVPNRYYRSFAFRLLPDGKWEVKDLGGQSPSKDFGSFSMEEIPSLFKTLWIFMVEKHRDTGLKTEDFRKFLDELIIPSKGLSLKEIKKLYYEKEGERNIRSFDGVIPLIGIDTDALKGYFGIELTKNDYNGNSYSNGTLNFRLPHIYNTYGNYLDRRGYEKLNHKKDLMVSFGPSYVLIGDKAPNFMLVFAFREKNGIATNTNQFFVEIALGVPDIETAAKSIRMLILRELGKIIEKERSKGSDNIGYFEALIGFIKTGTIPEYLNMEKFLGKKNILESAIRSLEGMADSIEESVLDGLCDAVLADIESGIETDHKTDLLGLVIISLRKLLSRSVPADYIGIINALKENFTAAEEELQKTGLDMERANILTRRFSLLQRETD